MTQQSMDFVDVSHWQGTVDFDELAKSGCVGIIAKATDGTSFVDDQYLYNRDGALTVGMCFASYHYLRHGNVEKQMQHYLDIAMPVTGERVVIDYEEEEDSAGAVDVVDLIEAVEYIRDNRPDLHITVYGASKLTDDVNAYGGDAYPLVGTSLWAARYSTNEPEFATEVWDRWDAWQYSQTGQVSGVAGDVDTNMFNGDTMACVQWFGPSQLGPVEIAPPDKLTVNVEISVDRDCILIVNGTRIQTNWDF